MPGKKNAFRFWLTAAIKSTEAGNLMKKLLSGLIILIVACSSNQVQFKETTNMNYLELGSYSLGIDKRFELMGTLDSDFQKDNLDDARGSQIRSTGYVFADLSDGQDSIKRGLVVYDNQIKDAQHFWSNEISYDNAQVKGKVDSGYVKVGNVKMAYMILKANPSLDQTITQIFTSKGSKIDKNLQDQAHISMIYYAKLIGRSRNVVIIYIDGKENPELAFNESLNYLTLDN
jgi:hypothetical protein